MSAPINHKANLVAELVERLGNATDDDEQSFLAKQLEAAGDDLEAACLAILRECRTRKAMATAIKGTIIADAKARAERLEQWSEKGRSLVAAAMAEAGLPGIKAPDMTVSFRIGEAPLIIDRDPTKEDYQNGGPVTPKVTYAWDKDAMRAAISIGSKISFARLGNPAPVLTVRTK